MAQVKPGPKKIRAFRDADAFETWLRANHDHESEIWIKIHKKASGLPTVTHAEALEVALCWGWIDAIRLPFDDKSFLQRFTPVSYTHLRAHETPEHIVCRLLLEKKK